MRDVSDASEDKLTTYTYSGINRRSGTKTTPRGTVLETRDRVNRGAAPHGHFQVSEMTAGDQEVRLGESGLVLGRTSGVWTAP